MQGFQMRNKYGYWGYYKAIGVLVMSLAPGLNLHWHQGYTDCMLKVVIRILNLDFGTEDRHFLDILLQNHNSQNL